MSEAHRVDVVGVIGAGTMGAGIAQVAAAAGHAVLLFDAVEGSAVAAKKRLSSDIDKLVGRGKISQDGGEQLLSRIRIAERLEQLSDATLVIEAIIENLDVKRKLFADLEAIVSTDAILATNTSSISITTIAKGLARPERVVGMHFFNPAPVMKLVEIVSGVATHHTVADRLFDLAAAWGKVPVHAKSTPGFIVNRVARPYYAEALRLFEEQVSDPSTLDALLTEGGGFRMGPFALMDLIGNDVNYAVSLSVFNAYYQEPRFRPSVVQLELVNAGYLGRKSGKGFYDYGTDAKPTTPSAVHADVNVPVLDGFELGTDCEVDAVHIALTDGRTANTMAQTSGKPAIVYDLCVGTKNSRLGFATSRDVPTEFVDRFIATVAARGIVATRLPDWPGLVVMRTVAMLANEGFEAVLQGVARESDVDAAMVNGVNYPTGPMAWAREIGLARVCSVIDNIHAMTNDPRYRVSLGVRQSL